MFDRNADFSLEKRTLGMWVMGVGNTITGFKYFKSYLLRKIRCMCLVTKSRTRTSDQKLKVNF